MHAVSESGRVCEETYIGRTVRSCAHFKEGFAFSVYGILASEDLPFLRSAFHRGKIRQSFLFSQLRREISEIVQTGQLEKAQGPNKCSEANGLR